MRDKQVEKLIKAEEKRQNEGLELIPSENYVSEDVLKANGSVFTNKYSEGYPGRRYYGGQDFTDALERLAIERVCKLFKCKFANVQPHSGAPANLAVYFALLNPGDVVLGMDLSHGGHLTHGHPMTLPAKIYKFVTYKMKNPDTGEIDYEDLRKQALEYKPKIILAGFSAYSRTLDYKKFVEIAREVGAITMADMAHIAGIIAGGALRAVFECLGVHDVVVKSVGTSNPHNMVKACFDAFEKMHSPRSIAERRGKKIGDIVGRREATTKDRENDNKEDN